MSAENSYRRLNRCGIDNCKTILYYLEDGQWFCKNGHRREGELDLEEDDELNAQTQTGSKAKQGKDEEEEAPVKVLLGRKGFELFLKCIQLILRKQVWVLVHEKGFPAQLEAVVRDLWALRLQKSLGKPQSSSSAAPQAGEESILQDLTDEDAGSVSASAVTDTEYWSSGFEVENAIAGETDLVKRKLLTRNMKAFRMPGLILTLGLCYLGAVMLRAPVSLGDMYKWVESQELPYKAALQEIPEKMKRLLSGVYIKALRPTTRLNPDRLQKIIHDLVILYSTQFDIKFPEINWPIIAMKYIRDLGLPLEIFYAVKRLFTIYPFTFHHPSSPTLKTPISTFPEAKLMSLILLSTKLLWGMDGIKRTPRDKTEPAAITPDMKSWERYLAENKFKGDSIFDWTDVDVLAMTGEELDAYMDWYEKTWLVKGKENSGNKKPDHLLNLFPTSNPHKPTPAHTDPFPQTSDSQKLSVSKLTSTVSLTPPSRDLSSGNLRPGEGYPLWRPDSILPTEANILLEAASAEVCLSKREMAIALRQVEVMFRDSEWLKGEKRRRK